MRIRQAPVQVTIFPSVNCPCSHWEQLGLYATWVEIWTNWTNPESHHLPRPARSGCFNRMRISVCKPQCRFIEFAGNHQKVHRPHS